MIITRTLPERSEAINDSLAEKKREIILDKICIQTDGMTEFVTCAHTAKTIPAQRYTAKYLKSKLISANASAHTVMPVMPPAISEIPIRIRPHNKNPSHIAGNTEYASNVKSRFELSAKYMSVFVCAGNR
jgi:hypothetical protein